MQVICIDEEIMPLLLLFYLIWQSYQSEEMEEKSHTLIVIEIVPFSWIYYSLDR